MSGEGSSSTDPNTGSPQRGGFVRAQGRPRGIGASVGREGSKIGFHKALPSTASSSLVVPNNEVNESPRTPRISNAQLEIAPILLVQSAQTLIEHVIAPNSAQLSSSPSRATHVSPTPLPSQPAPNSTVVTGSVPVNIKNPDLDEVGGIPPEMIADIAAVTEYPIETPTHETQRSSSTSKVEKP